MAKPRSESADIATCDNSMLKPIEPPIPPEPDGDYLALDVTGESWTKTEINTFGGGWDFLWRDYGPLTVYRPEVRG